MNWHYLEDGQQRGPVTEEQFTQLVQQGIIRPDTLIWCKGMEKWQRYGELVPADPTATTQPAATELAAGDGSLHIHHSATDGQTATREAACSQCGAVVPVSPLVNLGSAQLCPQCQGARARMMATGWGTGPVEYANPWLRFGASILDNLVCILGVFAIGSVLGVGGFVLAKATGSQGLMFFALVGACLAGLLFSLHYFVGRIARDGGPMVMRKMGMQVVTESGGSVGWWRALWRHIALNLVINFTLGLGNLVALFDPRKRCLHDMLSGTMVIKS
jgi:uncharacterized RDD family membrane protein YckC